MYLSDWFVLPSLFCYYFFFFLFLRRCSLLVPCQATDITGKRLWLVSLRLHFLYSRYAQGDGADLKQDRQREGGERRSACVNDSQPLPEMLCVKGSGTREPWHHKTKQLKVLVCVYCSVLKEAVGVSSRNTMSPAPFSTFHSGSFHTKCLGSS